MVYLILNGMCIWYLLFLLNFYKYDKMKVFCAYNTPFKKFLKVIVYWCNDLNKVKSKTVSISRPHIMCNTKNITKKYKIS